MERYVCVHGHFYQPPRENPWLEAIEWQDSAHPYHDWNERITAECYAPNSASRVLDPQGRIVEIVSNYSKMSFNFGPTLLRWMEEKKPEVYRAVLEADRRSRERFSGHGSAMAQPYNHMILPLANRRDRITQVRWGIQDFKHRFGRDPEGMWLPETAVDVETLEILAEHGIRFTILAPHQAKRVRVPRGRVWRDVTGAKIDPSMAYGAQLPSGQKISLFFYDGPISRAVAFEKLLDRGEDFSRRLMEGFHDSRGWPQLVHVATDGETFGHHHRFGDMALAYAVRTIESGDSARITNYGEFLEKHPPTHQVEIEEKTSWSCVHGVDRWWSHCGCSSGAHPEWNQSWRTPLRNALDWLRDEIASRYEETARRFLKDPWAARDDYIQVILDRSAESVDRFFGRWAIGPLDSSQRTAALRLLELQRNALLMYTSCGWFFDDISGIETVQVIQYAGRVIQLAEELFGASFEPRFLEILGAAKSNLPEQGDGKSVYQRYVKPAMVNMVKVGAHYAVSALFESYGEQERIYCYSAERERVQVHEAGRARLITGKIRLTSEITQESSSVIFGVMHTGDHHVNGGAELFRDEESFKRMLQEIKEQFAKGDFAEVLRSLDRHFGESTYSLKSIFRDEQRKIVGAILQPTLDEIESVYEQLYQDRAPLVKFLSGLEIVPPRPLMVAAEFVLSNRLRKTWAAKEVDFERIHGLLQEIKELGISLDREALEFSLRIRMEEEAARFSGEPSDARLLQSMAQFAELARILPFEVKNLWKVQNVCFRVRETVYPQVRAQAERGEPQAREWVEPFKKLCGHLSVYVA